jgi:Protein of unknown function (DUF2938).
MNKLMYIFIIGIGATAVMDLWSVMRKPLLGIPPPNYGLVGRWIAYMAFEKFHHPAIAASAPMRAERVIGWGAHYVIGVAFAALMIGIWGNSWMQNPTIGPALVVGIATVTAPFLLMQPGMGAGIAASKTPKPNSARLQSLITHAVFGFGLYMSGLVLNFFYSM